MPDTTDTLPAESTRFERDENGLKKGFEYVRKSDGRIDWKAHIPKQHIVFNQSEKLADEILKRYGAPAKDLVYADVVEKQEVDDKHILVLLAGFLEVADLRGYHSSVPLSVQIGQSLRKSNPFDKNSSRDVPDTMVSVAWQIEWIPNWDDPEGKVSGGAADATYENTGDFGYLTTMAENRSFVRAVKRGLGIRILGFDEIAKKDTPIPEQAVSTPTSASPATPHSLLQKAAAEAKLSFDQVKKDAIAAWTKDKTQFETDPNAWTKWEDADKRDCLFLIKEIKGKGKKKA